ncbi:MULTISPECIES: hypothetical protein [Saccharopolyspora]|jgi:hypothetical protein|uniref:Uncharacterized protein n=1 Tax=Saccharopolyspora endophytica TaxID=543886 RepID=A0ABS5DGA3_9PSEU|nr:MULTISPECIES: hypothetical protein [Saccharopolyspora]MBQ0925318.1 hypothetical protein [Saccharopolyspora endophytica]
MAAIGEMFPGRKLKHEGDQDGVSRDHDPGGPLDLDRGVVFLAPRATAAEEEPDEDRPE